MAVAPKSKPKNFIVQIGCHAPVAVSTAREAWRLVGKTWEPYTVRNAKGEVREEFVQF